MTSWKVEVCVSGEWGTNACRYATKEEANAAGAELLSRWFAPSGYRATECADPVNYEFRDGKSRPLKGD